MLRLKLSSNEQAASEQKLANASAVSNSNDLSKEIGLSENISELKGDSQCQNEEINIKTESGPKLSLSLSQPKPPKIKVRTQKNIVEGYDSEAPDREEDPLIEDTIILRVMPDSGLEYLNKACETNDFNGISIKFEDSRRAIITIDKIMYAAQLVDLPTITEVHKTFDRKNIYKSSEICQMLLVTKKIGSEAELVSALSTDPQVLQHQHGLTPPLHNVRNRRFHKRLSNRVIETLEAKVEELFRKDAEADEVHYELLPASTVAFQQQLAASTMVASSPSTVQDSEDEGMDDMDNVLGAELEKVMEEDKLGGENTENSEDDDDDDEDEDLDEDQHDVRQQNKLLHEEIRELEATIESKQRDANNTVNQIIKGRLIDVVSRMKKELDMKQGLLKDAEEKDAELTQAKMGDGNGKAHHEEDAEADEDEDDDDADDDELDSLF